MKSEATPHDDTAPEEASKGAPGAIVKIPDGVYKIYTLLTSTNVIDMSLSGGDKRNVKLFHDNNEPESTWHISYSSLYDAHIIRNGKSNHLMLESFDYTSAVYASYSPTPVSRSYHWIFKNAGTGVVYIESKASGHVLDVEGSNTANNTRILALPYKGSTNQKFKPVKIRDL